MQATGTKAAKKSWNLLLVEDNPADRFLLQSVFREAGVQCHWRVIETGTEAMGIGKSNLEGVQPDLILLDWQLPGATGLEVLATIKKNPEWFSIPVIMLTGMRSEREVDAAKEAGAYEVLEKPMLLDEWLKIPVQINAGLQADLRTAAQIC